jgi:hypothetical protein
MSITLISTAINCPVLVVLEVNNLNTLAVSVGSELYLTLAVLGAGLGPVTGARQVVLEPIEGFPD